MAQDLPDALLIFVKNPEKGKVKTRLAETVGDDKALKVYQKLLDLTKKAVDPLDVDRQVWYSDFIDQDDLWTHHCYEKKLQNGRNLGKRMQHAFRRAFREGKQKVVIIGSDCAELDTVLLRRAFRMLDDHRVVIGPSQDGGYYLLGMYEFYPRLFEQKPWSTSSVCAQTVEQLEKEDISFALLPELNDIDTEADLNQSSMLSK